VDLDEEDEMADEEILQAQKQTIGLWLKIFQAELPGRI